MEKCKWCGTECVNLNSLSQHITNKHKKSHKLYYDSFILKNEQDKFCICGKEKRYSHGLSGYYKNCGNINCRNILMNIAERKTCEEKYGNATYRNITLNKQTKKELYGDENYNNRLQAKETCVFIYGEDNPNKTSKVRNKIKETCKLKYGGIAPACSTIIQDKMKETNTLKYGNSCYLMSDEGKITRQQKMIEIYGTEHALQNETIQNKMKENNKLKYGYEWPCQQPHYQQKVTKKYNYEDFTFDSHLEIEFYKFLKEHNISFIYQPKISLEFEYDNEVRYYHPDFIVNNIICETKGIHFFKNKDTNNVMICPYHKKNDTPEKIEWRNGLYEAKHQCMIKNNVLILTKTDDFNKLINVTEEELGLTNK